jgi:cupin fold WbuC family metalloprotein
MLNAILPGSPETIHRHRESSESVVILKGCLEEVFFDEKGVECGRFTLNPLEGNFGIQIPQGTWHTVVVHEPSVIVEMKAGAYSPLPSCDVWNYE